VIVISDTSVFTNLAAIGQLHLLQQLYDRIFIPTAVYQELTVDPPVPGTVEVQTLQWLEVRSVSNRAMVEQLQNTAQLDPGESEAIALALEINRHLQKINSGAKKMVRLPFFIADHDFCTRIHHQKSSRD
jgi:predicted nucleic acid-binding protein